MWWGREKKGRLEISLDMESGRVPYNPRGGTDKTHRFEGARVHDVPPHILARLRVLDEPGVHVCHLQSILFRPDMEGWRLNKARGRAKRPLARVQHGCIVLAISWITIRSTLMNSHAFFTRQQPYHSSCDESNPISNQNFSASSLVASGGNEHFSCQHPSADCLPNVAFGGLFAS